MEYIGFYNNEYHYTPAYQGDFDDWREHRYPVTICAAKCGRWWIAMFEDTRDGLCHWCWNEQFEGEPDIPF